MSWLFSQALVEAFSAGTCSDGEPCAPLNVMPTPQPFWRFDKTIDFSSGSNSIPSSKRGRMKGRQEGMRCKPGKQTTSIYGCQYDEALSLNDGAPLREYGSKACLYRTQRTRAAHRGISWQITFPQWVSIWMDSGRWNERGRFAHQYVMARHGDEGPYHPNNVSIQLSAMNLLDAREMVRELMAGRIRKPGHSRGWTYVKGRAKPYQVMVGKKHHGCFATQAEAEAAYHAGWADRLAEHGGR